MAIKKCPRCELNYILDGGALCVICQEEVHGKVDREESALLCSVCGEAAALPGEDMCKSCLQEFKAIGINSTDSEGDDEVATADLDPEPVSSLDEIEAMNEEEDETIDQDDVDDDDLMEELAEAN